MRNFDHLSETVRWSEIPASTRLIKFEVKGDVVLDPSNCDVKRYVEIHGFLDQDSGEMIITDKISYLKEAE